MLPVEHNDPINEKILAISEDKIEGFVRGPFQEIADRVGVAADVVMTRIAVMLRAGTIRRVRQTLLATNLADGALVAWKVPEAKIDAAFDFMFQCDPFSGHVVLRSTDTLTAGSDYKLWTTVKVPHGFSLHEHCRLLAGKVGAERFRIMPAKGIFTLGVGHVRRKAIEPGSRAESPAKMIEVRAVELSEREWKVLLALKREFAPEEVRPTPWASRAGEVGRHHILTHCYWREAGSEFRNVNIMAVAHGIDKMRLLEHKAAIDAHLAAKNVPVSYTNVFWGGRSEIKPSEISPMLYREWLGEMTPQAA